MSFGNDIIGGGGELVRERMRSRNYVAGVSGWQIERDGTAEFNDTTIRGDLTVTDPDGSQVHIFDEDPGDGAVIDLLPAAATPSPVAGRLSTGYTTNGASHTVPFILLNGPKYSTQTDDAPTLIAIGRDSGDTDDRALNLLNTDSIGLFASVFILLDSPLISVVSGGKIKRGDITAPSLQNSWVDFGSNFQAAGYIELPDHTGMLTGVIKDGTTTSGTLLFTLPTGLRPADHHVFLVAANGGRKAQVQVQDDGQVLIQSPDAGTTWISLGGCHWPISGF